MSSSAEPLTIYALLRVDDPTGVSGTGIVASATEYPAAAGGKVAVAWDSSTPSVNVCDSMDHVLRVHGHNGRTWAVRYQSAWMN